MIAPVSLTSLSYTTNTYAAPSSASTSTPEVKAPLVAREIKPRDLESEVAYAKAMSRVWQLAFEMSQGKAISPTVYNRALRWELSHPQPLNSLQK